MSDKQSQKAGDGSTQLIAKEVNLNIGITEERAREVYRELEQRSIEQYSREADEKIKERLIAAIEPIVCKMREYDSAFEQFNDPAFQYVIRNVQATASRTDSKDDYEMLAELLGQHIEHKDDRIITSTVSEAIKIVDQIDVYSLQVLTCVYAILDIKFLNPSTKNLLYYMNGYIEQVLPEELPNTQEWVNHLDMLKLVRYNSISQFKSLKDIFNTTYTDNIVTGIKKDSDNYELVRKMFPNDEAFSAFMVDNDLLDGYVKLIINEDNVNNGQVYQLINIAFISLVGSILEYKKTIQGYYDKDTNILQQVQNNFMVKFSSYPKLKAFNDWISSLNYSFDLTPLGRLIANINLKRYVPNLPIFYKK